MPPRPISRVTRNFPSSTVPMGTWDLFWTGIAGPVEPLGSWTPPLDETRAASPEAWSATIAESRGARPSGRKAPFGKRKCDGEGHFVRELARLPGETLPKHVARYVPSEGATR